MQNSKKIDWTNSIFLTLTPILAIIGTVYYTNTRDLPWQTWLLFVFMIYACGIAITAGYHRLFSHKTYEANAFIRLVALLFGAAAFQNSALKWSSDHRDHHQFTDTNRDPYSVKKGFWHAHIGWILTKTGTPNPLTNVPDLKKDKLVMFQHKHIFKLGALMGFLLPTLIGALWGDALGGFIFGGLLRIVINHHLTFFINSLCHMLGGQQYSTKDTSRDNWVLSLFTYGEGYHNFHHTFPSDYRNGAKFYHWDPAKWIIWFCAKLNMAKNLKRVPELNRLSFKWEREESKFVAKVQQIKAAAALEWNERLANARKQRQESYQAFCKKRDEYKSFKKAKMQDFADSRDLKLAQLRREYVEAKARLKETATVWRILLRQAMSVS